MAPPHDTDKSTFPPVYIPVQVSSDSVQTNIPATEISQTFAIRLEAELHNLYESTAPNRAILYQRSDLIARVQHAISARYGVQFRVEGFGSTSYGVSGVTSDLDLAIVDQGRPNGFTPDVDMDKLPPIYNPGNLARTLNNFGYKDVVPIRAAVPIVKFTDPRWNIQCDINTNEQFGIRNSRLLKAYLDLTPFGRQLVVAVKRWAKARGLNDPAGTAGPVTLSSYSLSLMLLAYLQHIGHLPNLQSPELILRTGTLPSHLWARPKTSRFKKRKKGGKYNAPPPDIPPVPRVCCDTTFVSHPPDDVWPHNNSGMAATLIAFFGFYASGLDYERNIVSLLEGGIIPRTEQFKEPPPPAEEKKKKNKKEKGKAKTPADGTSDQLTSNSAEAPTADTKEIHVNPDLASATLDLDHNHKAQDSDLPDILHDEVDEDGDDGTEENDGAEDAGNLQPGIWKEHLLVIQDPFIRARNTSQNVRPSTVRYIVTEFERARDMLLGGGIFDEVCTPASGSINGEPPLRKKPEPKVLQAKVAQPKPEQSNRPREVKELGQSTQKMLHPAAARTVQRGPGILNQMSAREAIQQSLPQFDLDALLADSEVRNSEGAHSSGRTLDDNRNATHRVGRDFKTRRREQGFTSAPPVPGDVRPLPKLYLDAQAITEPLCMITRIPEEVSESGLFVQLFNKFGKVKTCQMFRGDGRALVTFETLESAKGAVTASLPGFAFGQGPGVELMADNGRTVRVSVYSAADPQLQRGDNHPRRADRRNVFRSDNARSGSEQGQFTLRAS